MIQNQGAANITLQDIVDEVLPSFTSALVLTAVYLCAL